MNEAACVVYIAVFLVMPPALLLTRLFDRARMPWGVLLGVSVAGGWLLVNLAYMFYMNSLAVQLWAAGVEVTWQQDVVPKNDFLLRFGLLFGPIYLLPWLFLYCAFLVIRWMLGSPREFTRR